MGTIDTQFAGSIPSLYDRHLGPLLFEPYADELARRAAELQPRRILETAAGTGIVTAALAKAIPDGKIVATTSTRRCSMSRRSASVPKE